MQCLGFGPKVHALKYLQKGFNQENHLAENQHFQRYRNIQFHLRLSRGLFEVGYHEVLSLGLLTREKQKFRNAPRLKKHFLGDELLKTK